MIVMVIGIIIAIGVAFAGLVIARKWAARRRLAPPSSLGQSSGDAQARDTNRLSGGAPTDLTAWSGYRIRNRPAARRRMGDEDYLQLGETHEP